MIDVAISVCFQLLFGTLVASDSLLPLLSALMQKHLLLNYQFIRYLDNCLSVMISFVIQRLPVLLRVGALTPAPQLRGGSVVT